MGIKIKTERRFLDIDFHRHDDHTSNFSLEIFPDCGFFNHHQDSTSAAVDRFLDDDDNHGGGMTAEERTIYWESQLFLLQEILEQYHSMGGKLREGITTQINKASESGSGCGCDCDCEGSSSSERRRRATVVVNELCSKGFNAHLRVSRWNTSPTTPAGSHQYIEVRGKMKNPIVLVVELGFRDEFRMGKACEEYNNLVKQLPEMYIGKWEHMKAIIRLLCEAARKSALHQNIHLPPWRKNTFMLMKWSPSNSTHFSSLHSTN